MTTQRQRSRPVVWHPVQKKSWEMNTDTRPWKVTNGRVCCDCYSQDEAKEIARRLNTQEAMKRV